jgi:hypothetical protein
VRLLGAGVANLGAAGGSDEESDEPRLALELPAQASEPEAHEP